MLKVDSGDGEKENGRTAEDFFMIQTSVFNNQHWFTQVSPTREGKFLNEGLQDHWHEGLW